MPVGADSGGRPTEGRSGGRTGLSSHNTAFAFTPSTPLTEVVILVPKKGADDSVIQPWQGPIVRPCLGVNP